MRRYKTKKSDFSMWNSQNETTPLLLYLCIRCPENTLLRQQWLSNQDKEPDRININKYKVNQRVFIQNSIFDLTWKIFTQGFPHAKLF